MNNKNAFFLIAGTAFFIVIVIVLAKGLIGGGIDKMADRDFNSAASQFLDTRIYDKGDNPFPMDAHFYTPDQQKVTIQDFRGGYVLLNFWATWCPGCVKELPSLHELNEQFNKGNFPIEVVALSMDREKTQAELVDFLIKYSVGPFALYHDTDRLITRKYPVNGMPTTLLIDPEGDVIYEFLGEADWTDRAITTFLLEEIKPFMATQNIGNTL